MKLILYKTHIFDFSAQKLSHNFNGECYLRNQYLSSKFNKILSDIAIGTYIADLLTYYFINWS
jgi:hypothetical protein